MSCSESSRSAAAEEQADRLDENRFSGAGLAGEHGESATEFDLDFLDDREVADVQIAEHRGAERGARKG